MTSLPITYAEDEPAMTNDPDSVHPSAADAVAVSGSDVPARPTSPAGWQAIETAPKDGTEVFVYVPGDSLFPTAARYDTRERFRLDYDDPDYMPEGWRWAFGYPTDFHEGTLTPTHWMPLPAPPVADPRQAQMGETK